MRDASVLVCGSVGSGKSSLSRELVRTPRVASSPLGGLSGLVHDNVTASGWSLSTAWLTTELFGSGLHRGECRLGGEDLHVDVWDLARLEHVSSGLAQTYFRRAHVVYIVFDVTSRASFEEVAYWHKLAHQEGPAQQICCILAHKIDLTRRRQVSLEEARSLAARLGVRLLETTCQGMGPDLLRAAFYEAISTLMAQNNIAVRPAGDLSLAQIPFGAIEPREPCKSILQRLKEALSRSAKAAAGQVQEERRRVLQWMADQGVPGVSADLLTVAKLLRVLSIGWADLQAVEMLRGAHMLGLDKERQIKETECATQRDLRDNEVRCPLGCGSILLDRASSIYEHVSDQCKLRQVSCPLGCGEKVPFEDVHDHVKGDCAKRFVECETCSELVEQGKLVPHTERWRYFSQQLWTKNDFVHWAASELNEEAAKHLLTEEAFHVSNLDTHSLASLVRCSLEVVEAALPKKSKVQESSEIEIDVDHSDVAFASYQSQTVKPALVEVSVAKERLVQAQLESLGRNSTRTSSEKAPVVTVETSGTFPCDALEDEGSDEDLSKPLSNQVESSNPAEDNSDDISTFLQPSSPRPVEDDDEIATHDEEENEIIMSNIVLLDDEEQVCATKKYRAEQNDERDVYLEPQETSAIDVRKGVENANDGESTTPPKALLASISQFNREKLEHIDAHAEKESRLGTDKKAAPEESRSLITGIANFDRSKLRHTAPLDNKSNSEKENNAPTSSSSNPLVAGIANFDRSKLKHTKPTPANEKLSTGPANPLMAGIANFDRSKLRHAEPNNEHDDSVGSVSPKKKNSFGPAGNSLFNALAEAIERRREAIEGYDD